MTAARKTIAMIPARLGSQRLAKKNLRKIGDASLFAHAIRRCREAACFDEIWGNSESTEIEEIAREEGVFFHRRPGHLANDTATSEQFIADFLEAHECNFVVQVHSIAPLLGPAEIKRFTERLDTSDCDVLLSCIEDQIEVAYAGRPVNFTFDRKTNSQDLTPVQRITWSITAWRRQAFLEAFRGGRTATYDGKVEFHPVSALSGHVIKTEQDLRIAAALLHLTSPSVA